MKKNKLLFVLPVVTLLSVTSCAQTSLDLLKNAPDYSQSTGQFLTFAYASPTNGIYRIDGEDYYTGENYQTVERYREYKAAGLNTMMIQWEDRYPQNNETEFAGSHAEQLMNLCVEAGIERCIITDNRIRDLSSKNYPIVGSGCLYETQAELNAFVASCINDYYDHPVFYGLLLHDEPFWQYLDAYGAVYRAIKAYDPDIYIESNLNPYSTEESAKERYSPDYASMTSAEAYEDYLRRYLAATGAEKVLMDVYPFVFISNNEKIRDGYFKGIQMIANFCHENGLIFEAVGQAFGGNINGIRRWSMPSMPMMQWQMNTFMAMGVQKFGFYTYWRKVANSTTGEWFNDGESFITSDGRKTSVYYTAQTLIEEMQNFAPTILNFEYQASRTIANEPVAYPIDYGNMDEMEFALLDDEDITITEGRMCAINELYDEANGRYMYMMMNAMDPRLKSSEKDLVMDYSLDFGSKYNAVMVYYRGQAKLEPLNKGVYTSSLDAGYAEYLIPYKA